MGVGGECRGGVWRRGGGSHFIPEWIQLSGRASSDHSAPRCPHSENRLCPLPYAGGLLDVLYTQEPALDLLPPTDQTDKSALR